MDNGQLLLAKDKFAVLWKAHIPNCASTSPKARRLRVSVKFIGGGYVSGGENDRRRRYERCLREAVEVEGV